MMVEDVAGFPFWPVAFNERGDVVRPSEVDRLLRGVQREAITDLFIFSHGWNNSAAAARDLYQRFFAQVRAVLDARPAPSARAATIGVVGIIWPSKRWDDEPSLTPHGGGAAGLSDAPTDGDLVRGLKAVFPATGQKRALNDLARLLDARPDDPDALDRFYAHMKRLADTPDATGAEEDNGEAAMLAGDAEQVFRHFASATPDARAGGAAGFGDAIASLWGGAKEALRAATYWEMKKRAGVVGQHGVGPLIGRVAAAQPQLRVHLLGHSFGARVVAFALAGLPDSGGGAASPVKSVFLLQGAFSHFAFADALPFDPARGGALAGAAARVDGPLLVSHSRFDEAVGRAYPLASMLSRDDAAAADDLTFRWGAMGHDGAQEVNATEETLGPVGRPYRFAAGTFVNLDGNAIIVGEHPPPDGHGDIFHPEVAWAALAAAEHTP